MKVSLLLLKARVCVCVGKESGRMGGGPFQTLVLLGLATQCVSTIPLLDKTLFFFFRLSPLRQTLIIIVAPLLFLLPLPFLPLSFHFFFCLRAEDDEDESPFQLYNRLVVSFFSFVGLMIIKE